jgi:tRNA modification GTPase TrmE
MRIKLISSLEKCFLDDNIDLKQEFTRGSCFKNEIFRFGCCYILDEICDNKRNAVLTVDSPLAEYVTVRRVEQIPVQMPVCRLNYDDDYIRTTPGLYPDVLLPLEENPRVILTNTLKSTLKTVNELIGGYAKGEKIKNGVKVALVGRPNTGKSSLLNALLCYDKAIVSSVAGTTRDVVEGSIQINGVKFDFYDTAGIRNSGDGIEMLGIERSQKILNQSDVAVVVLDGAEELLSEDKEILQKVKDKNHIIVYNKKDLFTCDKTGICISAKTGDGVEILKTALYEKAFDGGIDRNAELIVEERHLKALEKSRDGIMQAISQIGVVPLDLVAEDVKLVWDALGEITGKTATEEIIDEIFAKFCVGK